MQPLITSQNTLHIVKNVAHRMRDPLKVKSIVLDVNNVNPHPVFAHSYWHDLSLEGYPGVLLLLAQLDKMYPDEKWDESAHQYVLEIKKSIEENSIFSLSMFSGLAGVCFSINEVSRNGTRYVKLLNSLHSLLIKFMENSYFSTLRLHLKNQVSHSALLYDVIAGIGGVGNYILSNPQELLLPTLNEILSMLVSLTYNITVEGKEVPGWYVASELQLNENDSKSYPKGNFNLGLAHGIPGVLAILSKALHQGIIVRGQREAILKIVTWIKRWRQEGNGIYFWNTMISFEEEIEEKKLTPTPYSRQAWCYGSPGITRSLYLAGEALKDTELKQFAFESFKSVFSMSREHWRLPGPTMCHGIAGLLMITHVMAADTQSQFLMDKTKKLEKMLFEFYQEEAPFGFRDKDPIMDGEYADIDQAGLLEGASGVLLALLSLHSPKLQSLRVPFSI